MSKVLIANGYFYKLDTKQWKFKQPYPPLGTLWAAAVVREQGFTVSLFDASLRNDPRDIRPVLLDTKPKYLILYDDGFNYLTKMCLTVMREATFTMVEEGKRIGCTVIVSSSDAADHYMEYFQHGVDFVVRGEGEETLRELLNYLEQKKDPQLVSGIAWSRNGKTGVTSPRPVTRDLDALPTPAWDLLDIAPYHKTWKHHHGYFSLNIATTRGCPFKCNWCAKPIYGNRYNSRTPRHVVTEIESLISRFQPDHLWMADDIFGLKPGWVHEFKNILAEKGIRLPYKIQSRVDLLLEENTVQALADSGVETVWVGAESGSQKILDAMDKGTTVAQIQEATELLRRHGVRVAFFLQFGYPGEQWRDVEDTLNMVLDLMPDEIGISVSYPLPGTKFYENVRSGLTGKQNWTDSDDLAMMFHGTYTPTFYRILHRYVHSRYRIQRGIRQLKRAWSRSTWSGFQVKSLISMIYYAPISLLQAYRLKKFVQI